MEKWKERRAKVSATGSKTLITAKTFLGKEGNLQFITSEQLLNFNDTAREDDVKEMAAFFSLVRAGYKIIPTRKVGTDVGGNEYKYQNFNRSGNNDGAKVLNIGKIFDFIEGLYDSKFVIDFTYDQLIEEAELA